MNSDDIHLLSFRQATLSSLCAEPAAGNTRRTRPRRVAGHLVGMHLVRSTSMELVEFELPWKAKCGRTELDTLLVGPICSLFSKL